MLLFTLLQLKFATKIMLLPITCGDKNRLSKAYVTPGCSVADVCLAVER